MRLLFIFLALVSAFSPCQASQRGLCAPIVQGFFFKKTIARKLRPVFERTTLEEKLEIIHRLETKAYERSRFNVPTKTFRDLLAGKLSADGQIIDYSRIDFASIKGKAEIEAFLNHINFVGPIPMGDAGGRAISRQGSALGGFTLAALIAITLSSEAEYNTRLIEAILGILGLNAFTFWNFQVQYPSDLAFASENEDLVVFQTVLCSEAPDLGTGAVLVGNRFGHSHVLFMLSQEDRDFRLDIVHWAVHFRGD